MDASIIILTKNGGSNFPRLLERIYSQEFAGTFEVIVIDSGSTDGTLEVANNYPVRLNEISPGEFHYAGTRNLAASLAKGKYIVSISHDILPLNKSWLQRLCDNFVEPRVAMVVGRQVPWENTRPPERFFYHYYYPGTRIVIKSENREHRYDSVFISAANLALRSEIWQEYRFNDRCIMGEDQELASRLLACGYHIVYEPEAVVYHSHNFGIRGSFNRSLDTGFAIRHASPVLPQSSKSIGKRLMNFLWAEIQYLHRHRLTGWLPYVLLYELLRYTGYILGRIGLRAGSMVQGRRETGV